MMHVFPALLTAAPDQVAEILDIPVAAAEVQLRQWQQRAASTILHKDKYLAQQARVSKNTSRPQNQRALTTPGLGNSLDDEIDRLL